MGTIEMFDHTADVGMKVAAGSLDDLFRTAAEGLFDYIVVNRDEVRGADAEAVDPRAESPSELLGFWLNELIFRSETRHRVYARFDVTVADEGRSLHAEIAGEPIDRDRHVMDHEVKAVTHHGLTLERTADGWAAEMILDI